MRSWKYFGIALALFAAFGVVAWAQTNPLTDITVDEAEDTMRELAEAVGTEAQRLVTARQAVHTYRTRLAAFPTKAAYTPTYAAIDAALAADPTNEDWLRVDRIRDRAFARGTAVYQETASWAAAMPLP